MFIRHTFDLRVNCGLSLICNFLHSHRKPTIDLYVEGLFKPNEILLLQGPMTELKLGGPIVFHDIQLNL
jgi:hypothetical protein